LIIEDRAEIAKRLRITVDKTDGIAVVGVAGTLEHGLAVLEAMKPRIALVDLCLPDGPGLDVIKRSISES